MNSILQPLNEAQKKAVTHTEGPSIIIAGPGSGKTRVLSHRIAWLIANGIDPFRILALTFTNKAANEMKERITRLVGDTDAKNIWMGTFHSVFARILRVEAELLGYNRNFTIYDTEDSKNIIKMIIKENNFDDKIYSPGYVLSKISSAKTNLIDPTEYNNNPEIQNYNREQQKPHLGHIYTQYWNKCRRSNAMDFDDILFNMNLLLMEFPAILEKYQYKFSYILVDEYQDTCFSQYLIVKKLSFLHKNICVVGDDAQGIYSFRGAKIENILSFTKDFPECEIFKLEQNYRSTKHIVQAANSVISYNEMQLEKTIWTDNVNGEKIKILRTYSENDEASQIAHDIFQTKVNKQVDNHDFAVLFRTNAQSRPLEEAFRKMNIPYRLYGGLSFYKRKEIKDLLAYFRIIINRNDDEALLRIINIPQRGIGKTTLDKVIVFADKMKLSLWDLLRKVRAYAEQIELNRGTVAKIEEFMLMIEKFSIQVETLSAFDIAKAVLKETGYLKMLKESSDSDDEMRIQNIEELINGIQNFTETYVGTNPEVAPTLSDYLLDISLLADIDDDSDDKNKVSLMTVHSAKGLEFPYVYITGVEENLFPAILSLNTRTELEEERRLFYVALTRAMRSVTVSYAESRMKWGKREISQPSRFIDEIDEELVEFPRKKDTIDWGVNRDSFFTDNGAASVLRFKPKENKNTHLPDGFKKVSNTGYSSQKSGVADDIDLIIPGAEVEHEQFGKGKVLQVDGTGGNKKALVFFPASGKKNLLLKFAKLRVLG